MADKGEKESNVIHAEFAGEGQSSSPARRLAELRKMRRVSPLGMRVLVRVRREANKTEAGLYLPQGVKESQQESLVAEVIEVASAVDDDTKEEANISGVPNGALVLISREAGVRLPWDDDLRLVETKEVLAIIHEVSVS